MKEKLKLIPLGGLGEIGKNMLVLEYGEDLLVIDCGLMFPQEEMLGIDLVLPDFSYLKKKSSLIKGIILTHGHEDHTGALPYVLKEIKVPVYGTKLTLGLVQNKLQEFSLKATLKGIKAGDRISLGSFGLEFIQVSHSIPDGVGIIIETPLGLIVHSGDFKFDPTPIDGRLTDYDRFLKLKERKVLALLSDSTNAELSGNTPSERSVGEHLKEIFFKAKGKIILASFASHIHRIQQVLNIAQEVGRKVAVTGRSLRESIGIASKLGYLKIPEGILIDILEVKNYPPKEITILSTGSQGEPLSALAKMASHDHPWVKINPTDTVIISARPVPGNERTVYRAINQFYKSGAEVYHQGISPVHASGHAAREELKLMLNLVSPRYFIPIHGEPRHLKHHADLAKEAGIPAENIFILENGEVVEFAENKAKIDGRAAPATRAKRDGRAESGTILVDGLGVGDIGDIVLRDRQRLAEDGILMVVVAVSEQSGEILAEPDIVSRGFVYIKESQELLEEAKTELKLLLKKTAEEKITDWGVLKAEVRRTLSKFIYERLKRRPMILPVIVEV